MKFAALAVMVALAIIGATPVAWSQQKPVVGISGIQTVAQNISCKGWDAVGGRDCNQYLAEGFRAMLETALVRSNKMDVMERGRMDTVVGEQALGQMGLTDSGGRIGGLTGVDYLVYGSITKFGARESGFAVSGGRGIGSRIGSIFGGGISLATVTTEMAVDIRVTDVASGQIILADTVEGSAKTGEAFSIAGISSRDSGADPFADVQRILAAKLSESVVTTSIPFKVIQVQADGTIILNYGDVFLKEGDVLALFEVGEQFVDPDTGEVLGSEETEIGQVQITSAEAKFSKGRLIDGSGAVTVGSVLKRSKIAETSSRGSKRKRSGGLF